LLVGDGEREDCDGQVVREPFRGGQESVSDAGEEVGPPRPREVVPSAPTGPTLKLLPSAAR